MSEAARDYIVADVSLVALKNRAALRFKPPTAPEYREMAAILHGVDISVRSVRRLWPKKKGIVCDWRELRTKLKSERSRAYLADLEARGLEPGHLFGSQQVFIPRDPRESDSDTDSDT